MEEWPSKKRCSRCLYSEFNKDYPDLYPSVHICHNKESEHYGKDYMVWYDVCDKFQFRDEK
jgi:hypothetical protein